MKKADKGIVPCLAVMLGFIFVAFGTGGCPAEAKAEKSYAAPALMTAPARSYVEDNRNAQDYKVWGNVVENYITETENGYMRVAASYDGKVHVEYYDAAFQLLSVETITKELELFGGFYAGADAYYLVFGQENLNEDDSREVFRIVKYDKKWNRLGAASLYGANTVVPFYSGSLRMAEYGGFLYIRTCHEMYASDDGLNHQANVMIQVDEASMQAVDSYTDIFNADVGYVSHSFNQFILVDDAANLVGLDHGDAYPRSVVLGTYTNKAGEGSFCTSYDCYRNVDLFDFPGEIGENETGASVGGFEYSDTSYLTALSSVDWNESDDYSAARNIYILATDRGNINSTKTIKLTNYPSDGKRGASTPQLVKINNKSFLLLWTGEDDAKVSYTYLDESGNRVSDIYTADGHLSDCKPIVANGEAVWYACTGGHIVFYTIDQNGQFKIENRRTLSSGNVKASLSGVPCTYTGKRCKPRVAVMDGAERLEEDGDYRVVYKNNKNVGTATALISGMDLYTGTIKLTFKIVPETPASLYVRYNSSGTLTCEWSKSEKASGYQIQYKNGKKKKIVTVRSASASRKVIRGLKNGPYQVRIRAIKQKSGKTYCSRWSFWVSLGFF